MHSFFELMDKLNEIDPPSRPLLSIKEAVFRLMADEKREEVGEDLQQQLEAEPVLKKRRITTGLNEEQKMEDTKENPLQQFVCGTELHLKVEMRQYLNITIENIVMFLEEHPEITSLDLSNNEIGDADIQILATNTTLTFLNVEDNRIGCVGAQALAANKTLTSLNIKANKIRDDGAQAFAANTTLTSLNMGYNKIGGAGVHAFAANTTLTSLDVRSNRIGDAGAQALAANTTLTSLNVRNNQIGNAGVHAFAANTTLTSLNVGENQIGEAGAKALAANKTLTSLNIRWNQIGDAGAHAFTTNTTLFSLDMSDNAIQKTTLESIENTRSQNIKFQAAWQQAAFLIGAERVTKSKGFPPGSADQLYTYELCEFLGPNSKLSGLDPAKFAQLQFFNNRDTRRNPFEQKEEDLPRP